MRHLNHFVIDSGICLNSIETNMNSSVILHQIQWADFNSTRSKAKCFAIGSNPPALR